MKAKRATLWAKFVKLLPKKLIYFCTLQLGAEATTGKYGSTIVPRLTFMDAVKRFENDHKVN